MSHPSFASSRSVLVLVIALTVIFTVGSLTTASALRASAPVQGEEKSKGKKNKKAKTEDQTPAESEPDSGKKEKQASGKKGKQDSGKKGKQATKAPGAAPTTIGKPALWEDRGNVAELDLFFGIGSEAEKPKPPFQFKEEDATGTNPKIKVVDAAGMKWNIKFDEEVHAELAASRIVWACGYRVEESYFVPSGRVNGVTKLTRAAKFVSRDGSFSNGLFEKRPDNIARRKNGWSWGSNPFSGSKEMSGLVLVNVLLCNWDAKDTNNAILGMYDDDGSIKEWYTVADWGGSFGKMGGFMSHTKWDLEKFAKQPYLNGVSGNSVKLNYSGKMSAGSTVPLEHARWFAGIVGQLSDDQLRQAFKAAGATPTETEGFTRQLRKKINELKSATGR